MKLKIWVIIAAAPLVFVTPVTASARDATSTQAKPDSEKLICRSESVIGSRVKKNRVCMTSAQWVERKDRGNNSAGAFLEDMRPKATNGQ